jgi:hypothetical protein
MSLFALRVRTLNPAAIGNESAFRHRDRPEHPPDFRRDFHVFPRRSVQYEACHSIQAMSWREAIWLRSEKRRTVAGSMPA